MELVCDYSESTRDIFQAWYLLVSVFQVDFQLGQLTDQEIMLKIALQNEEPPRLKCQWCQGEKSWVKGSNQRVEHQKTATDGQEYQLKGLGQVKRRKVIGAQSMLESWISGLASGSYYHRGA